MAAGRIAAATGCRLMGETFPARMERGGGLPAIAAPRVLPRARDGLAARRIGARPRRHGRADRVLRLPGPPERDLAAGPADRGAQRARPGRRRCARAPGRAPRRRRRSASGARRRRRPPRSPARSRRRRSARRSPPRSRRARSSSTRASARAARTGRPRRARPATRCSRSPAARSGMDHRRRPAPPSPVRTGRCSRCRRTAARCTRCRRCGRRRARASTSRRSSSRTAATRSSRSRCSAPGIHEPGPVIGPLTDLGSPALDWVALAGGMGVPAVQATTAEELTAALEHALAEAGPHLIEAVL